MCQSFLKKGNLLHKIGFFKTGVVGTVLGFMMGQSTPILYHTEVNGCIFFAAVVIIKDCKMTYIFPPKKLTRYAADFSCHLKTRILNPSFDLSLNPTNFLLSNVAIFNQPYKNQAGWPKQPENCNISFFHGQQNKAQNKVPVL